MSIELETEKIKGIMATSQYKLLNEAVFDYTSLFQLSGKEKSLKFIFNGLNIYSQFSLELDEPIDEDFSMIVKSDLFSQIINKIEDEKIELSTDDNVLKITYSGGDISIPTMSCSHVFKTMTLEKDDYIEFSNFDNELWNSVLSTQVPLISTNSIYLPYRYVCLSDKILTGDMACNIFSMVDINDTLDKKLYALYSPLQIKFLVSQKDYDVTYYKDDNSNALILSYTDNGVDVLIRMQLINIDDKDIGSYNEDAIINMFKYDLSDGYYELDISEIKPHLVIANILDKKVAIELKFKNDKLKLKNKNVNSTISVVSENDPVEIDLSFDLANFETIINSIPSDTVKIAPIIVDDEISGIRLITDTVCYAIAAIN